MPYFRIDMEGGDGEHIAVFAEALPTGQIVQQFGVGFAAMDDLEHCRLHTITSLNGKALTAIEPDLGWERIAPEDYELATELKRKIALRDHAIAVRAEQKPRCAKCGGTGKLASTGAVCPDCKGEPDPAMIELILKG